MGADEQTVVFCISEQDANTAAAGDPTTVRLSDAQTRGWVSLACRYSSINTTSDRSSVRLSRLYSGDAGDTSSDMSEPSGTLATSTRAATGNRLAWGSHMVEATFSGLYDELLNLVPSELHHEFGEVFYSGRTTFVQPSPIYLLGFNPGGDPSKPALNRYTIGFDLDASRAPERRDWSGFEDDWREFGPGAVAFQRRVRHLVNVCGYDTSRTVPASNVIFVRSTRVETLDAKHTKTLLHDCWAVHEKVISTLGVRVVACFGQAAGRWVRAQLDALAEPAIENFTEDNGRRWQSATHRGR
ncbi:MAG: hypothetical protein ABI232_05240, partial [Jatrophihabitantaceae bacterium]